jgi:hypothetical protein
VIVWKKSENGLDELPDMPYHTPFENSDKAKIYQRKQFPFRLLHLLHDIGCPFFFNEMSSLLKTWRTRLAKRAARRLRS